MRISWGPVLFLCAGKALRYIAIAAALGLCDVKGSTNWTDGSSITVLNIQAISKQAGSQIDPGRMSTGAGLASEKHPRTLQEVFQRSLGGKRCA